MTDANRHIELAEEWLQWSEQDRIRAMPMEAALGVLRALTHATLAEAITAKAHLNTIHARDPLL